MQNLNSYFIQHDLFDEANLISHCDRHLVRMNKSSTLSHLRILHYAEEAVYGKSWTEFCKMCRGVVVDLKNKKLLTVPYEKFWNLTEAPGPSYKECVSFGEFECSEKLDGSFIELYWDAETQQPYATTKGSLDSEQGVWATAWARANLPAAILDPKMLTEYTLMWEMVAYDNRIVIDYKKKQYPEGLYLIGIRHLKSEKVFSYQEVQDFAREHKLLTLKTYSFASLDVLVDNATALDYQNEGFVVRFKSNGILTKVKSKEYLRVHRFVSSLSDKNLLDLLIAGQEEEVYNSVGLISEEYRDDVISTLETYKKDAVVFRNTCYDAFAKAPKTDRKSFAQYVIANVVGEHKPFMFQLFDSKDVTLQQAYQVFRKR